MNPVSQSYDASTKKLTIRVNDQFNFNMYSQFRDSYRDLTTEQVKQVELDLKSTVYIDSAALGMILLLEEHFGNAPISISHCSELIYNLLKVANFDRKFTITQ